MSNQPQSRRYGNAREIGGPSPAVAVAERRVAPSPAWGIRQRPVLAAGIVLAGLLLRTPPCTAQRSVGVGLGAGETYVLKGLDQNSTPRVRYDNNSQCFLLECSGPGKCSVIGAAAGHGSVTATMQNGETMVYDITVSAAATPGKPLKPGSAPPATGDIFANKTASAESGPVPSWSGTPAGAAALPPPESPPSAAALHAGAPLSGPGASPERPAVRGAGAMRYVQTQPANALELPSGAPPQLPNRHYLPDKTLKLSAGASRIFDFTIPLRRVAIADTEVADVEVISPHQLMLVAHKPGATTLSVWQEDGLYYERPVRIEQGGPQQVELHVVVAELDRSKLEAQGLDIAAALANAGVAVVGLQGNVATPYSPSTNLVASGGAGTIVSLPPNGVYPPGGTLIPLLLSSSLTYGFTSQNGQWTTNAMFQILEEHDMAKILSEPMLIADSGEQAKFLSGGEIPIVIAQALNTSIVFKQFGTSVIFIPTVIDDDEIELVVSPEFSQPDYTQGVQLFGFTVPAFITRRAETKVRLRENQTLIIAGLVLETPISQVRKTPYLGDIPYFGYVFRHTYYRRVKTELVMTVTPEIVRPITPRVRVALPTDRGPMTPEEIRTRPLSQPDAARPRFP